VAIVEFAFSSVGNTDRPVLLQAKVSREVSTWIPRTIFRRNLL